MSQQRKQEWLDRERLGNQQGSTQVMNNERGKHIYNLLRAFILFSSDTDNLRVLSGGNHDQSRKQLWAKF